MAANLNIDELTRDERLDLIEALWDSLDPSLNQLEMTEEQRRELDSRIEEMDRDESLGIPWNDMLRSIRKRV
jgi:putative addiction module component (TIGR02574 family)